MSNQLGEYDLWVDTIANDVAGRTFQLVHAAEGVSGHDINLDDILTKVRELVLARLNER